MIGRVGGGGMEGQRIGRLGEREGKGRGKCKIKGYRIDWRVKDDVGLDGREGWEIRKRGEVF